MKFDVVVVGSGFNGCFASWYASRKGLKTALIDKSDLLGGVICNHIPWKDYSIDLGAHNLDLRNSCLRDYFIELLQGQISYLDNGQWGSMVNSNIKMGYECPVLSDLECINPFPIIDERLTKISTSQSCQVDHISSLEDYYHNRFGKTYGQFMAQISRKLTGFYSQDISPIFSRSLKGLDRISPLPDPITKILKQHSHVLDDVLAISETTLAQLDPVRRQKNIIGYPLLGGMGALGMQLPKLMNKININMFLGKSIVSLQQNKAWHIVLDDDTRLDADVLIWSIDPFLFIKLIDKHAQRHQCKSASLELTALEVDSSSLIGPDYVYDYNLNFNEYRYSSQGRYSRQETDDKKSFVISEAIVSDNDNVHDSSQGRRIFNRLVGCGFLSVNAQLFDSKKWLFKSVINVPLKGADKCVTSQELFMSSIPNLICGRYNQTQRHAWVELIEKQLA
ncbi:NAD(P)-binding protein [Synechococcus sp. HB1133]|uniref:NAD(P)/FAD-dependent oxidoreductase n=1 Tax=unclassified Synechococcus TaxID=2626047 RepID=UPI0014080A4C|nr:MULTISPECIES: NAD(P)/FAD-dependent oxidoreductase [unclassified Synechococcus]MCB4421664.1 NAD(P)-binding protein [Synechococcus sp. HB1133]MCB4430984.1 NAD(P)-binding protein [Synechococcus sp. HBA1120]NHI80606.1 NAD(P)/FAD-dependent oxidoreductase [Synechococcus sp. HB1133]